ncbi:MAG: MFS transporter [Alsobacter sp.]
MQFDADATGAPAGRTDVSPAASEDLGRGSPRAIAAGFRPASLDALNLLLADVRGALGPYLNVFLVTEQHWSQSEVGLVTTVGGLLGLAVQTPIGAAIDATRRKRALVVAALVVLAIGGAAIAAFPAFWPVMVANALTAIVGDVFGPAVAALTLGLYARQAIARRLGRNAAFDHAGNVMIALVAGAVGALVSQRAVFLLAPLCAAAAIVATLSIPAAAIDHETARGARDVASDREPDEPPSGLRVLLTCRPLLVFAGCAMLFHFANAPLLPLVGQKLALANRDWATPMMSACIIAAQLVMLPLALLVGHRADQWGRKPLLFAAFLVLPVRAVLYTLSDAPAWLIGVQVLDGVGAGLLGALTPLVVADLTRGTGRFNVSQAALATVQGLGASASGLAAGLVVDRFGYTTGFLGLGAVSLAALALLAFGMPETGPSKAEER